MILNELKLSATSELKLDLVKWIKTGKISKDILKSFLRYGLVTKSMKLTLKGAALAAGLDVDSNDKPDDIKYSVDRVKKELNKKKITPFTPRVAELIFTTKGVIKKDSNGKRLDTAHKIISDSLKEIL